MFQNRTYWTVLAGWLAVVALTTAALVVLRNVLDKSHIVLAYLLVVLLGTARLGRRGGVTLSLLCFFAFNFFLLPPYRTLTVADQRDWLVLVAFLATSVVAAQLLYRAQHEAETARMRASEIDRMSTLGAETLNAGRAEEAVNAIARVIRETLGLTSCEIFLAEENPRMFRGIGSSNVIDEAPPESATTRVFDYLVEHSAVAVERIDGTVHVISADGWLPESAWTQRDAKVVVIPLIVRNRAVGLMRLAHDARVFLDPEQRRFAQALAYYASLGVERVRLTAEAERTAALEAAHQLKDSFVAAVSHDLRTPLTTIKGLAHELTSVDERAHIIEVEADRLNAFVGEVLDFSRLNAGEMRMNVEINAAEDLVGAALAQVAGIPRGKDIRVTIPEGELVVGRFDFVHSLRCMVNLLENALKYSPIDTDVEIVVENDGRRISFSVLDRGPGIQHADVARMFEPFVRGDTGANPGAGLGLAIAHRLAVAQGGELTYTPRQGGGSVFTLVLPAVHAEQLF